MCTFATSWKRLCYGDSGGPLVYKTKLIGIIASSGFYCKNSMAWDAEAKMSFFYEWIRQQIMLEDNSIDID